MTSRSSIWRLIWDLAWKAGALVVAAALVATGSFIKPSDGDEATSLIVAGLQGDMARVRMQVGEGKSSALYSLENECGAELARVTYIRGGNVVITAGPAFPVRPGLSMRADGGCQFSVACDGYCYKFKLKPDGPSGFAVDDYHHGARDGLSVMPDGALIHEPPFAD
jgi:hypothetical protein